MNILHRTVRKTLAKNPTRTWATIIGIMLSMALVVAVLEGAYSGLMFMLDTEGASDGYYQVYYYGLDRDTAAAAAAQDAVKDSTMWELVGWSDETGTGEDRRPLLCIDALGADPKGLLSVRLAEGRMPQSENELLLPADWFSESGLTNRKIRERMEGAIGQTLSLSVGKRLAANGDILNERDPYQGEEGGETIASPQTCSYTVVGVYADFDRFIEPERFCYRALTVGEGIGEYRVFATLKMPLFYQNFRNTQTISDNITGHLSILRYYGASDNALIVTLYSIAGMLVALVAFGSISLIYNSFAISVSERTRQFGILRSIGATKKQIRAMVRYEALLLGFIGIGLGLLLGLVGIGVTLRVVSGMLVRMMSDATAASGVRMHLVISPVMLAISVLVCLVTTLLSARIPALRAVKIDPISAIRQSNDVKLSGREVKTSRLMQKLFGFEGMMAAKNFKRNRKRYRATVLSLFLSIVLFISASSLTSYLRDSINDIIGDVNAADIYVYYQGEEAPETLYKRLAEAESVTAGSYYVQDWFNTAFRAADLSADYKDLYEITPDAAEEAIYQPIVFVDDDTFRMIAAENGQLADAYFDYAPQGMLVNEVTNRIYKDGKSVYKRLNTVDPAAFPIQITAKHGRALPENKILFAPDGILPTEALRALGIEEGQVGLYDMTDMTRLDKSDADGNSILGSALLAYEQTGTFDVSIFDSSKLEIVPEDTLYRTFSLTIAAPCKTTRIILPGNGAILYPYSRMAEVLDAETAAAVRQNAAFCFQADNHSAAAAEMLDVAETMNGLGVNDLAESNEMERLLIVIVNIFAYGFIILISLIAVANVFNTITTNILLRRRELAMLKSIGLGEKGFRKMLNYECIIYGLKGLLWGLPAAALFTFLIWKVMSGTIEQSFYIPWYSVVIAVFSVFLVVFVSMLYAARKIKKDNPIDALKNENL